MHSWKLFFAALFSLATALSQAADVRVAVAANFAAPMRRVAELFLKDTGHTVQISLGSTGKLYTQITHGAPFQVLLAADEATPFQLESQGMTVKGSRFTFAVGRLALWSPQPGWVDQEGAILRKGGFSHLAIADPKLAPYGAAAKQTLEKLGLWQALQSTLVQGENIGQTLQFVASGNAPLGFVALSQVMIDGGIAQGSAWIVPATMHAPLRHDAVLLLSGASNPAAMQLIDYLRSDKAHAVIRSFGYEI
jgi:molybdate transport system substrate-binding protein